MKKRLFKKLLALATMAGLLLTTAFPVSAETLDSVRDGWVFNWETEYYKANTNSGSSAFMSGSVEDGNTIGEHWAAIQGLGAEPYLLYSNAASDGTFLRITGINSLACVDNWQKNWSYSMRVSVDRGMTSFGGIMIRTNRDESGRPTYPLFETSPQHSDADGPYVGDSGIGITFASDSSQEWITLFVLTKDAEGNYSHIEYKVTYPYDNSEKTFSGGWSDVRIDDKDETLSLYLNDELVASVAYGSVSEDFYKNATIYDANNTQVAATTDAMISAYANIGLASRASALNVDNLAFKKLADKQPDQETPADPTPGKDPSGEDQNNPQTGDYSIVPGLIIVACAVAIVAIQYRKKFKF